MHDDKIVREQTGGFGTPMCFIRLIVPATHVGAVKRLAKIAQADFPGLDDTQIKVVFFYSGGIAYLGIRFFPTADVPAVYQAITRAEVYQL